MRVELNKPSFELREASKLYRALLDPNMSGGMSAKVVSMLEPEAADASATHPLAQFRRNSLIRHRDLLDCVERREQLRSTWARFFEDYEVPFCPAVATTAFPHDHSQLQPARSLHINRHKCNHDELFLWSSPASCSYLPATVAPVGTARGLPVGIRSSAPTSTTAHAQTSPAEPARSGVASNAR